tara:strand:+ start:717 stop:956 length:240 start_codon:yes stop_codon:yes gene_type:complete
VRVIGYTKVIPPGKALKPNKPNHKLDIIKNFVEGVRMCGDNGLVYDGYEMLDCEVAMMQGSYMIIVLTFRTLTYVEILQ